MKLLLLSLVAVLSSCCMVRSQEVQLTETKIDVVRGLLNPVVMKDGTVRVAPNSKPVLEKASMITVTGPDDVIAKGYDMEAEKKPNDDLVDLIEDSPGVYVLTGTGSYKIRWYGQDPKTGRALRKRIDIELGPPPPPITIELVYADIVASKDVEIVSVQPIKALGGKGLLSYDINPAPPIGLTYSKTGFLAGVPTAPLAKTPFAVTVGDEVGQTATSSFTLSVNELPPIPPDAWDNVGQRLFKVAQGAPRAKLVAELYRDCQKRVAEALDPSMNASLNNMVANRNSLLSASEQQAWAPAIALVTETMTKRWPMDRQTLADYLGTVASALERLK